MLLYLQQMNHPDCRFPAAHRRLVEIWEITPDKLFLFFRNNNAVLQSLIKKALQLKFLMSTTESRQMPLLSAKPFLDEIMSLT